MGPLITGTDGHMAHGQDVCPKKTAHVSCKAFRTPMYVWTHIGHYDTRDLLETPAPARGVTGSQRSKWAATQMELPGIGLPSLSQYSRTIGQFGFWMFSFNLRFDCSYKWVKALFSQKGCWWSALIHWLLNCLDFETTPSLWTSNALDTDLHWLVPKMFYTSMLSLGCQVAPNHPPCITVPPRPTYLVLEPPLG